MRAATDGSVTTGSASHRESLSSARGDGHRPDQLALRLRLSWRNRASAVWRLLYCVLPVRLRGRRS
jgi:hypothetical protein